MPHLRDDELYERTLQEMETDDETAGKGRKGHIAIFSRPEGLTHLFVEGGGDFGGLDLTQEQVRWLIETLGTFLTT